MPAKGQTISAPHMHVVALQQLEPLLKPDARVLDVGSGSGYLTACFAAMIGNEGKGKVIGIEIIDELVAFGNENIRKANPELLDRIKIVKVPLFSRLSFSPSFRRMGGKVIQRKPPTTLFMLVRQPKVFPTLHTSGQSDFLRTSARTRFTVGSWWSVDCSSRWPWVSWPRTPPDRQGC